MNWKPWLTMKLAESTTDINEPLGHTMKTILHWCFVFMSHYDVGSEQYNHYYSIAKYAASRNAYYEYDFLIYDIDENHPIFEIIKNEFQPLI